MRLNQNQLAEEFPIPDVIQTVVCCDLDETYIPYAEQDRAHSSIAELERFLIQEGVRKGILLGWITGTNLRSALRKADGYISRSPHFICCSLGSEFYWIRQGIVHAAPEWEARIRQAGYDRKNLATLQRAIAQQGILLQRQNEDYQGRWQDSFYYRAGENRQRDLACITALSQPLHIRAVISPCNPAAGDPTGCYDVTFIPNCCGKDEAVGFLRKQTGVAESDVIAFGDSANDLPMFACAGRAYLVANAERSAIEAHGSALDKPYCEGILSVLRQLKQASASG